MLDSLERELQFSEISFFEHAEKSIKVENKKFIDKYKISEINIDTKRIGYYVKSITKVKMLHNSLSFL